MQSKIVVFLALLFILLFAGQGFSEDAIEGNGDNDSVLEELRFLQAETDVIYAATKTEIPVSKAPGSVTVINYAQIRKSGARTLPELLRLVPGVNVRWNPMMQTIDMRGFGGLPFTSRVLLLIDGVPYNSWNKGGFPQQPGFDFFVLQNVKRVEVIRGPGSVLYGENAYWGVINIVSLSGEDLDGGKASVYGGSLNTLELNAMYGKKIKDGSVLLSVSRSQGQLPTEFWFKENNSKVDGTDLFLKGKYKDFTLSYYRHDDNVDGFSEPIPDPALPPGSVFKSADKIEQTVDIAALKYNHTTDSGNFSFGGDVSYAQRNGMHCGSCHALPQKAEFAEKENHGFQLTGDFRMGIHSIPHNNLLIGVDTRSVNAKDHKEELLSGPDTTQSYTKPAVYLQDQISLLDDKLNLIAGLRYDDKTHPFLFEESFSPRLALVYNQSDSLTLRAGWSKAFRIPSFSEFYQNSWFINAHSAVADIPFSEFKPNPDLKSEKIQTYDLGATYKVNPKLTTKLDLFYSEVDDFIVTTIAFLAPPDLAPLTFENHPAKARIYGFEADLNWEITRRLTGFVNWSFQEEGQIGGGTDSTGKRIEFVYAPRHKLNLGAYFRPFTGFSGALEVNWHDKVIAPGFWYLINSGLTDPTVRSFGEYTYVNIRLNYDLPYFRTGQIRRPLRLTFYVKDLLDEKPVETLSGVNTTLAGRRFFGGFEYRF